MVAFSCISIKVIYAGFLRRHKGAFKTNYLFFLCILNFLFTYSFLKILTAVLGKIFMLIDIYLISELLSECDIMLVERKTSLGYYTVREV